MSELRQNIATREWVVIAPERLKGEPLQASLNSLLDAFEPVSPTCPFCPGNLDERFDHPVDSILVDQSWQAICVENLYKIVSMVPGCESLPDEFERVGIHRKVVGCGHHELVIEHPRHNTTFATMTLDEVAAVVRLYINRLNALARHNLITLIFKNHGPRSGASQRHPHSQLVSLQVVPGFIRYLLEQAQRFFDSYGTCVFCKVLAYEIEQHERVIYQNDRFAALVPYAASAPYEVQILPREHDPLFSDMSELELRDFSDCLRVTMRKLYIALSNPDFNFVLRNPPYALSGVPFYHWHLQIVPYLRSLGGFELGSHINVNVVEPEEAAEHLRNTAN